MSRFLEGKVILVTGGSSGIGRTTALVLAREGAKVVVADVNRAGGEETVRLIAEADGEAVFVQADVSKASEVKTMVDKTLETYGQLDCAFNNAGILEGIFTSTADYPEESWDRVVDINLKGVWLCMKYEIPQMIKQGGGVIVNMSSVAGLFGNKIVGPAYIASKHGVVGLTKVAALEYAQQGIRVNAVCPAIIDNTVMSEDIFGTNPQLETQIKTIYPAGRIGGLSEVAEAVAWFCSDAAPFITGHALPIDGGLLAQ
jgi:NAD(P)-dependent dehydrogenase (short-subunit alcohol dehydrogenase family)